MTNHEWEHLWIRCIQAHTTPDQYQKIKAAWEGRNKGVPLPFKHDDSLQRQEAALSEAGMSGIMIGLIVG